MKTRTSPLFNKHFPISVNLSSMIFWSDFYDSIYQGEYDNICEAWIAEWLDL